MYISIPDGDFTSCEFTIVSLDGKRWRWEVCGLACGGGAAGAAAAERDVWVCAVEAQILASLQGRVRTKNYHEIPPATPIINIPFMTILLAYPVINITTIAILLLIGTDFFYEILFNH